MTKGNKKNIAYTIILSLMITIAGIVPGKVSAADPEDVKFNTASNHPLEWTRVYANGRANISFTEFKQNDVWDTNAELYIRILNPDREKVTKVGCYLYNESGGLEKFYTEDCNLSTSYVNYTCNINADVKFSLTPGTQYKIVLFAIVNGNEYQDIMRTFQTTGSSTPMDPVISEAGACDGTALVFVAEQEYETFHGQQYNYQYGTSPWCCNFVSWCARRAGISTDVIKSTATVQTMYDNLMNVCGAKIVAEPQKVRLLLLIQW